MEKREPEYRKEMSDDELINFFSDCREDSLEHFQQRWQHADTMWRAYGGETLSRKDISYLRETGREPVDWNIAIGTINTLLGTDAADKKEARFQGVDTSIRDQVVAEGYTRVVRHFMQRCGGAKAESEAFHDMLVGGYGFNERFMDTSRRSIPPVAKHVPYWEMLPDPNAVEPCLVDAKFWIRRRRMTIDNVQAKWPDRFSDLSKADVALVMQSSAPRVMASNTWSQWGHPNASSRTKVTVYDFQYKRFFPMIYYRHPETLKYVEESEAAFEDTKSSLLIQIGAELDDYARANRAIEELTRAGASAEEVQAVKIRAQSSASRAKQLDPDKIEYYRYDAERWYRATIVEGVDGKGYEVLDRRPVRENIATYTAVTGYPKKDSVDERAIFFGPMQVLHSSQMALNRAAMVINETLGRGAKGGGGMIEDDALVGSVNDFAKKMAAPGAWVSVKSGALGNNKVKEIRSTPLPPGIANYTDLLVDMVSRVTLVTDGLKGTMEKERSNVLITNLQQQSLTGLLTLYDQMATFRKQNGLVFAAMVYYYVPTSDINRICEDMVIDGVVTQEQVQNQAIPGMEGKTPGDLMKAESPFEYDIVADHGPSSATHKQAMWQLFAQTNLLPQLIELLGPAMAGIVPDLIRYMPIDSSMADSMAKKVEMGLQRQEQQSAMMAQQGGSVV